MIRCVFQNTNIMVHQIFLLPRAACDRQFLKSEKMKSKLRKYLTKNYSSLNQSHDGWLQNTLMILIINVAIFLSCRLMLQIFSLHKSILILGQLCFHDMFLPFSSYCIFESIFYKYLQNNRNCCFKSVPQILSMVKQSISF